MNYDNKLIEEKIREHIKKYVRDYKLVEKEENIFFAEKAFKCNGIIRWCLKKRIDKIITDSGVNRHYEAMERFIRGEIDLVWNEKGFVEIKNNQQETSRV